MTTEEWEAASEEERAAEFEKVRTDHRYAYNTYFRQPGQPEISESDWNSRIKYFEKQNRRLKSRRRI